MKKFLKVAGIILGVLIVVHTIFNITFSIQLHNKIAELKGQGRPMTIAEVVPPPVPDEENAAVLYNKAFVLMKSEEGSNVNKLIKIIDDVKSLSDISQWTDEQRKEIPQLINSKEIQDIYSLLEEGSKKPRCDFNIEYEKEMIDIKIPRLNEMRNSMRLLRVKALLEAESDNVEEAFDTLLVGLKMSNHLKDEPIVVSQLVRIACDEIIIDSIEGIADSKDIPVENTTLIINELSTHEDIPFIKCLDVGRIDSVKRILQGKTSAKDILQIRQILKLDRQISQLQNRKKDILQNSQILQLDNQISQLQSQKMEVYSRKDTLGMKVFSILIYPLYKPILKKDEVYYLTLMAKMQDNYNLPYYKVTQENENNPIEGQIPGYCILTRYSLPALERERYVITRHQAIIEVCKTGLALKIYKAKTGTYPETLDFLSGIPIDPFSGKELIYKKSADGFILYSLGPNMKDDGGISPRTTGWQGDYDIIWGCWDCKR